MKRYIIRQCKGQLVNWATVVDTKTGRRKGTTNSHRDGDFYLELARIQCNALNKAARKELES